MNLEPLRRRTLTVEICEKLAGNIVRGDWAAGMRIPAERDLTQQLGVGRSSIREGLKALEVLGMVESRLGEGTFVCERSRFFSGPLVWAITSNSEGEIRDLVEARRYIETDLSGLAAERATQEDLKIIGRFLDEMEAGLGDRDRFLSADLDFHSAIAQSARNGVLMNALDMLRNLMRPLIRRAVLLPSVSEEAFSQHQAIFMGIAKHNPEQARAAMTAHLDAMSHRLVEAHDLTFRAAGSAEEPT